MYKVEIDQARLKAVQEWLGSLPAGATEVVVDAGMEWLVGNEFHGAKQSPYYKYINRYAGFPNLFFTTSTGKIVPGYASQKQFNYVHWAISQGIIKPGQDNRTGKMQDSYVTTKPNPYTSITTNTAPYAKWVRGETMQTRMHDKIGWRSMSEVVSTNIKGMYRHAQSILNKWLKAK